MLALSCSSSSISILLLYKFPPFLHSQASFPIDHVFFAMQEERRILSVSSPSSCTDEHQALKRCPSHLSTTKEKALNAMSVSLQPP